MADQDVSMDVCANLGDSRLKLSGASFSAFRTSITSDLSDVISGVVVDPTGVKVCVQFGDSDQTVLEIYDGLTLLRKTTTTAGDSSSTSPAMTMTIG